MRAKKAPDHETNDIQSWVRIGAFSSSFGPRNGQEMAIRPTKKADFEARELSYPIMTFPGHFWNLQVLRFELPELRFLKKNDIQSLVQNSQKSDLSETIGIDSGASE